MGEAKDLGGSSASFLVRFWLEPRESSSQEPVFRGFLRNLQTGEEQYVGDPSQLETHIRRFLRAGREVGVPVEDTAIKASG